MEFLPLKSLSAEQIEALTELVIEASKAILSISSSNLNAHTKVDGSPVTLADQTADALITSGLAKLFPEMPVVSEESLKDFPDLALRGSFCLVDPLDGTKEFLAGRNEFTVNIAIITNRRPIAGFIAAPRLNVVYRGAVGGKPERLHFDTSEKTWILRDAQAIACRKKSASGPIAVVSRSHLDTATSTFIERLPTATKKGCGSSLKFCLIAEGSADLYPRLAPTSEWDIAAGHAIIEAAGGRVISPDGRPILYGNATKNFIVPHFIAWGDPTSSIDIP